MMKRYVLPLSSFLLLGASLFVFRELILSLAKRDYVGALLLLFVGLALLRHGSDAARWSQLR